MFPLEFRGEVRRQKTRVMGLPCGESCMILTSAVFVQFNRVTDVQTANNIYADTRYSKYAVARKNLVWAQTQWRNGYIQLQCWKAQASNERLKPVLTRPTYLSTSSSHRGLMILNLKHVKKNCDQYWHLSPKDRPIWITRFESCVECVNISLSRRGRLDRRCLQCTACSGTRIIIIAYWVILLTTKVRGSQATQFGRWS